MNTAEKSRAELLAMAEALEWAFRSSPYGYMKPLPTVNEKIAELRAAATSAGRRVNAKGIRQDD